MALTKDEIRRLEKAKAWWRPFLGFVGAVCLALVVFTVCFAVMTGMAQLSDAMAFFVSLPPSIAALLSVQVAGRSYEKSKDSAHYSQDDMLADQQLQPTSPEYPEPEVDPEKDKYA